jgi:uncharacterized protein (DUF433 family)
VTETPPSDQDLDETTAFGCYSPDHDPSGEDELYFLILRLIRQDCETPKEEGAFDSWAISAYEAAILALEEAGFVELERGGRIYGRLTEAGRNFETWMEYHERKKRIREARHMLATIPGVTAEQLARTYGRYYGFAAADLIDWSGCPDIESVPGRCSGQPVVVGTRILVAGVIENAAAVSLEELVSDIYPELGLERARRILAYARDHGALA